MSHRHDWQEFNGAPSTNVQLRYCRTKVCGVVQERIGGQWHEQPFTLDRLTIQLLEPTPETARGDK